MKPRRLVKIILTLIILSGVALPEKRAMSPEDLAQRNAQPISDFVGWRRGETGDALRMENRENDPVD